MKNNFGFKRWNFQYEIDGYTTLDPATDKGQITRVAARKRLFMDQLIQSGFLSGKRVLDLGCNSGYWSMLPLTEDGAAFVHGVDASAELIRQADFVFESYSIEKGRYRFEATDAYSFLESSRGNFDVVLCLGFFYHITDPFRMLKLLSSACTGFAVIDTVVHNSDEALISVRPVVVKNNLVERSRIGMELVSSPKAIAWMGEQAGFTSFRELKGEFEGIQSMWNYIKHERGCYILSKGPDIDAVWPNAIDRKFLNTRDDLSRHGYFPEMDKEGRNRATPLIPVKGI